MVDPLSLTVLTGVALTEGIKFLYGQVTDLLKRRRDLVEKVAADPPAVPAEELAVLDELASVLRGARPSYVVAAEARAASGDFTAEV